MARRIDAAESGCATIPPPDCQGPNGVAVRDFSLASSVVIGLEESFCYLECAGASILIGGYRRRLWVMTPDYLGLPKITNLMRVSVCSLFDDPHFSQLVYQVCV